jgi:mRNA-degrading endonuclease toxin of MazEF toxin-antitoxin module
MNEEYDKWNKIKKCLFNKEHTFTIKQREIYWIKIGKNIGFETYGKGDEFLRPVLVYKSFGKTFLGIPLTTKSKSNKFYFEFSYIQNKLSYANLSQIRLFDTKRINQKSGKISQEKFNKLKIKFLELID